MDELVVCRGCHRHVKSADAVCPFCRRRMPARSARALAGAVALGIGLSVAACGDSVALYGAPPPDDAGTGGTAGSGGTTGTGGTTTGTTTTTTSSGTGGGAVVAYGPPPPVDAGAD